MKHTLFILFIIIILTFSGCKKDDVRVQEFSIISESVFKGTTTIILTVNYSYPTTLKSVIGYISESIGMNNAIKIPGFIDKNNFVLRFNDLHANTTYYIYYEYSNGIDYFENSVMSVTTNDYGLPTVTTNDMTDITATTAVCNGNVLDNGGLAITARGFCWSTTPNPSTDDNHTTDGTNVGCYTSHIYNLTSYTTYYVRAYISNSMGTTYGEQISFVASDCPSIIAGLFSISFSKTVCFSKGNLQYQASTKTWRFAENQYDYIGIANSNISATYSGWIDLFGWGTSSYNHGAVCYQPYSTNTTNNNYYAYGSATLNLNDQSGNADWGYNSISNGGDTVNRWRTLTRNEWVYVFHTRNTASGTRYAKAIVNNIKGVILFPNDWSNSYYNVHGINDYSAPFGINNLNDTTWIYIFEDHGAVFLPAAGYRCQTSLYDVGEWGCYWSSTISNNDCAYHLRFNNSDLSAYEYQLVRSDGNNVRLVCDAE